MIKRRVKDDVAEELLVVSWVMKYGVSGGGHPNAAGARMPKPLLKTLVEELNRLAGGP